MIKKSIVFAGALAAVGMSPGAVGAETLTGCLTTTGHLIKLAGGDRPAGACGQKQQEVSIVLDGKQPDDGMANAPYRFVGFSTATTNGAVGFVGLHALCQADFGSQARACTSEEYIRSPHAEAPATGAWLLPSVAGGSNTTGGIDFSGQTVANCRGWTEVSGNLGLSVREQGGIDVSGCSSSLAVTCCAPEQ